MPYIKLETNSSMPDNKTDELSRQLAAAVAAVSGEPKESFQVELAGGRRMRMASATDGPIVHVEIKGIELEKSRGQALTDAIAPIIEKSLAIQGEQLYIAVISNRNSMWRVNADLRQN